MCRKWSSIYFLATLLLGLSSSVVLGQGFEVSGFLTEEVFSHNSNLDWKVRRNFKITVNECNSSFTTSNENSHISQTATIHEGTIYKLVTFYGANAVTNAGTIRSEPFPRDDGSAINYLWLAYASACYFSRQTNNFLEPIWVLNDHFLKEEKFKIASSFTISTNSPFLPIDVSYLCDGKARYTDNNGTRHISPVPAPFDKGYTNAVYQRLGTTNIGDLEIPTRFRFTRNFISGGSLTPRAIINGTGEEFRVSVLKPKATPEFDGKVSLLDLRYAESNPPVKVLAYQGTSNSWVGPNLDKLYKKRIEIEKRASKPLGSSSRRKVVIGVMAIILLGGIILIFSNRTKTS